MQTILIILLFISALSYLGWRAYRSLNRREAGCSKGCGCSADQGPTVRIRTEQ